MGLNIEMVRDHIQQVCAAPAAYGAVALRAEGVRFEIGNNTVKTVVPDTGSCINNTTRERNQHAIARRKRECA